MKTAVFNENIGEKRRLARGFSLIELIIAVGILGVGLVIVAGAFPFALSESQENTDTSRAALAGQSIAELLQARGDKILAADIGSAPTRLVGTEGIVSLNECAYNPWRQLYTGGVTWTPRDPDDYRVYVWLKALGTLGPWRATIVVCRYGEYDDLCVTSELAGGDWVVATSSGYCYYLQDASTLAGQAEGGGTAVPAGQGIRNVVGVYYTFISP